MHCVCTDNDGVRTCVSQTYCCICEDLTGFVPLSIHLECFNVGKIERSDDEIC